jgi:hypothetical protein
MTMQSRPLLPLPVLSVGAVTTRRFVGYDGAQASAQGQDVFGVSRETVAAAGYNFAVDTKGTAVVEAGAALNPGDRVISDNQGRAIPNTGALKIAAGAVAVTSVAANGATDLAGSDLPEHVAGRVMPGQSATAAGQFVEILLT